MSTSTGRRPFVIAVAVGATVLSGTSAFAATSSVGSSVVSSAAPSAPSAASTASGGQVGAGSPDPYAPKHGHAYRRGAVPTRPAETRMRHWRAANPAAGQAAVSAANLRYGGGVHGIGVTTGRPKVYLVFYGSQWGSTGTDANGDTTFSGDPSGMAPRLQRLFRGLGTGGELWSGVMTQYCEGSID